MVPSGSRSRAPLLVAASVLAGAAATAQDHRLLPAPQFRMGDSPQALALGDLDGDGALDAATAEKLPEGQVSVALGDGLGGFLSPRAFPVGAMPDELVLADLDGDGDLDAVTADEGDATLTRLLGNGAGGVHSPLALFPGGTPASLEAADLDGDGDLDLLVATQTSLATGELAILAGDGAGGFAPPDPLAVPFVPNAAASGDLDADGFVDVVAGASSWLAILLGSAAGLGPPTVHAIDPFLSESSLRAGDVDADGSLDLVHASGLFGAGRLDVHLGDGAGGLGASSSHALGELATSFLLDDLDGDGDLDAAAGSQSGVAVLHGTAGAGFTSPVQIPAGASVEGLAAGDLDGDGRAELVTANRAASTVTVLRGLPDGSLEAPLLSPFLLGGLALGDLDGDGAADAVVTAAGVLGASLGDGAGGFAPPATVPGFPAAGDPLLADVDGDGEIDAVAIRAGSTPELGVALGDGSGGLGAPLLVATEHPIVGLAASDLDLDGDLDVAAALRVPPVFPSSGASFAATFLGDGTGALAAHALAEVPETVTAVAAGDLDQDGLAEIVTGHAQPSQLLLHQGDGAGGIAPGPATLPLAASCAALALADLDEDGKREILVAHGGAIAGAPQDLSVLVSLGAGAFVLGAQAKAFPGSSTAAASLAPADLDSDGHVDVVLGADDALQAYLPGDGLGGLGPATLFTGGPRALAHDVDHDGRQDVVSNLKGLAVAANRTAPPVGASSFGAGTPGCGGVHGLQPLVAPQVGASGFGLSLTNVPPGSFGHTWIADAADLAGADVFSLGFLMHVDVLQSALLLAFFTPTSDAGASFQPLPIPASPVLAGAVVVAQSTVFWPAGSPCRPSPLGVSSSRGLALTIQP